MEDESSKIVLKTDSVLALITGHWWSHNYRALAARLPDTVRHHHRPRVSLTVKPKENDPILKPRSQTDAAFKHFVQHQSYGRDIWPPSWCLTQRLLLKDYFGEPFSGEQNLMYFRLGKTSGRLKADCTCTCYWHIFVQGEKWLSSFWGVLGGFCPLLHGTLGYGFEQTHDLINDTSFVLQTLQRETILNPWPSEKCCTIIFLLFCPTYLIGKSFSYKTGNKSHRFALKERPEYTDLSPWQPHAYCRFTFHSNILATTYNILATLRQPSISLIVTADCLLKNTFNLKKKPKQLSYAIKGLMWRFCRHLVVRL